MFVVHIEKIKDPMNIESTSMIGPFGSEKEARKYLDAAGFRDRSSESWYCREWFEGELMNYELPERTLLRATIHPLLLPPTT